MPKRIQSPSSINTYKQCPRKYYYQYTLALKTLPNIHQTRGKIAHTVLENFFNLNTTTITLKNYELKLKLEIQKLLLKYWQESNPELKSLNLTKEQQTFYFEETMLMLLNWLNEFNKKIKSFDSLSFPEIFKKLTPLREKKYLSQKYSVQGFIDAIQKIENETHLIDYKTSANFTLTNGHTIQIAIYSLLYQEKHGHLPTKAGIYFLRYKLKSIKVDHQLLDLAKKEIELIHQKTQSQSIDDYPQNKSSLCQYSTGQCDFYPLCYTQKTISEYIKKQNNQNQSA